MPMKRKKAPTQKRAMPMKKPKKQQNHWPAFKLMVIPTMKEVGTPSTKCTGFEKVHLKTKIAELLFQDAANSKTASVSE